MKRTARPPRSRRGLLLGLGLLACAACTGAERELTTRPDASALPHDAGGEFDAGAIADAGSPDAAAIDAGGAEDAGVEDAQGGDVVTFTEHVWPVFEASGCDRVECHGSVVAGAGLVLLLSDPATSLHELSRDAFVSGRPLVAPGQPEQSELFIHGRDANLVVGDLSQEGLEVFRAWIEDGASPGPELVLPASPTPTTCSVDDARGFPEIPMPCSPTCTSTTRAAIIACRSEANPTACQDAATAADPTPALQLGVGPESATIDCGACLDWQTWACAFSQCPAEVTDVLRCQNNLPLPNCDSAVATLSACLDVPTFDACRSVATEQCYAD